MRESTTEGLQSAQQSTARMFFWGRLAILAIGILTLGVQLAVGLEGVDTGSFGVLALVFLGQAVIVETPAPSGYLTERGQRAMLKLRIGCAVALVPVALTVGLVAGREAWAAEGDRAFLGGFWAVAGLCWAVVLGIAARKLVRDGSLRAVGHRSVTDVT